MHIAVYIHSQIAFYTYWEAPPVPVPVDPMAYRFSGGGGCGGGGGRLGGGGCRHLSGTHQEMAIERKYSSSSFNRMAL